MELSNTAVRVSQRIENTIHAEFRGTGGRSITSKVCDRKRNLRFAEDRTRLARCKLERFSGTALKDGSAFVYMLDKTN